MLHPWQVCPENLESRENIRRGKGQTDIHLRSANAPSSRAPRREWQTPKSAHTTDLAEVPVACLRYEETRNRNIKRARRDFPPCPPHARVWTKRSSSSSFSAVTRPRPCTPRTCVAQSPNSAKAPPVGSPSLPVQAGPTSPIKTRLSSVSEQRYPPPTQAEIKIEHCVECRWHARSSREAEKNSSGRIPASSRLHRAAQ